MIKKYVEKGESFSFETTLSGRVYARFIPQWQEMGYGIKLFFLKLPDPYFAIARVKQRVTEGGAERAGMVSLKRWFAVVFMLA